MKSQTLMLLKKENLLGNTFQTIIWTVCCFGMYFIPSYPMYVGPFYITLCIMMTFAMNQSANDILYTVMLPVRKIDVAKARFLYCAMLEFFAFICAIIGGLFRTLAHIPENKAGIGITISYFGLQLLVFSVFNLIFLGNVYKNPLKPGLRFLFASIGYFLTFAVCELPVWAYYGMRAKLAAGEISELPLLAKAGQLFTSSDSQSIIPQLLILAGGIVIYIISWLLTFRRAARQFEKYDL